MKLLQVYSNATGLEPRKPKVIDKFFPLDFDGPYITVQGGSGQISKIYDLINEVLDVLGPILQQNNIKILQLGGEGDAPLKHCVHLQGKTSILQARTLLKHGLLILNPDSWMAHEAGALDKPLVAFYGTTSSWNHGPFWYNNEKTILIDSHRNGRVPTYGNEGQHKSINKIKPEEVVDSALKLLGANVRLGRESLLVGQVYSQTIVEWVPNCPPPQGIDHISLIARHDCALPIPFSEELLFKRVQQKPTFIFTDKELNLNAIFTLKQNILSFNMEVKENTSVEYVKNLKKTGVKLRLFSKIKDQKTLSDIRLKFLDVSIIEGFSSKSIENFWNDSKDYLNKEVDKNEAIDQNWFYRSNKFIISNNQIFPSKAALKASLPIPNFEANVQKVINSEDFWEEQDHFYIFKQKVNQ